MGWRWPLLRLGRWQRRYAEALRTHSRPFGRDLLRPALEIGATAARLAIGRVFIGDGLGAQSWGEALGAFPDFVIWFWAAALLVLTAGIMQAAAILRARRANRAWNTAGNTAELRIRKAKNALWADLKSGPTKWLLFSRSYQFEIQASC